jgi:hypothetical protein
MDKEWLDQGYRKALDHIEDLEGRLDLMGTMFDNMIAYWKDRIYIERGDPGELFSLQVHTWENAKKLYVAALEGYLEGDTKSPSR